MRKRLLGKAIGLTVCMNMVLTSLAGCQTSGAGTADKDAQEDHEPITIITGAQNYSEFDQLLQEKYPEVNLEYVSFSGGDTSNYMGRSLEEGDIPDIYTVSYVPDSEDQKENLLNLANKSVVNEYPDTMLDNLSVDGGIYLLPSRYALLGIVYNKTLMEENNWEVPKSFEEMKALAPQIREAGYEVTNMKSSLTGTAFGIFFALGNTNYFNTPEGAQWKIDYLEGKETAVGTLDGVAEYMQKWIDEGFISTYYYDHPELKADEEFDAEKAVFQLYSNRTTGENTTDEYGIMPFLSEDGSNNMLVRLVSRYYGLNKELGEAGNEQKLEDALKVFELMASEEGQDALAEGNASFISSTSINDLPEGSPYEEVADLINKGSMVDMVYSGWENHIVPLIENYGNDWINGNITSTQFLEGMDIINEEVLSGKSVEVIGTVTEDINVEDTARLCAIAEGKAVNADAALVSLPAFHGFADGANLENRNGVHCGIYEGEITKTSINMYTPRGDDILTVKLSGSEIKNLVKEGYLLEGDSTPYDYCLVTKDDQELEDDKEYTLAIADVELNNQEALEKAEANGITPKDAVCNYITEIGTVTADSIVWE